MDKLTIEKYYDGLSEQGKKEFALIGIQYILEQLQYIVKNAKEKGLLEIL